MIVKQVELDVYTQLYLIIIIIILLIICYIAIIISIQNSEIFYSFFLVVTLP